MAALTATIASALLPAALPAVGSAAVSNQQRIAGERQAAKQEKVADDHIKTLQSQRDQEKRAEETLVAARRSQDLQRAQAGRAGSQGRAGTLLTGPLGLTGDPSTPRKTILGG